MKICDYQQIQRIEAEVDGVFALSDFRVLFPGDSEATRYRKLEALVEAGELIRVKKGIYARPGAALSRISQRISPEAYLSLGTVLAEEGLIGSVPGRRVWAVRAGRPRRYVCSLGVVEHLSMTPALCFGWRVVEGLRRADAEKAYLDAWYFTYKGRRLSFDVDGDVDVSRLDSGRMADYLSKFDARFQTFFLRQQEGG